MTNQTIIINSPGEEKSKDEPKQKVKRVPVDKKAQAAKGAKIAFSFHGKEMFKGGAGFLKHLTLTFFYGLRLLGFALQGYSKRYNAKNAGNKKPEEKNLKW